MDRTDQASRGADSVGDVLEHYGIKGMKWGVRRSEAQLARAAAKGDTPDVSEDYARATSARAKPASQLSNKEMQDLITRMNLEQQYKKLVADNPLPQTRMQKAKTWVAKEISDIGRNEASRVVKGAAQIAVEQALKQEKLAGKVFAKEVGNRIVPKKK